MNINSIYKPLEERTVDGQYRARLRYVLRHGIWSDKTEQGPRALTCFGDLPRMVFRIENGVPFVTARKISFWRKAIAEIIAFINGARTIDDIESYGCDFWKDYRGMGLKLGLGPNDMGPGSYGSAFHDFEVPEGGTLNQFEQLLDQIRKYHWLRTHVVTPWKPYYTPEGPRRKVIIAPCHGWLHFRVLEGKLYMHMWQRSADLPVGVPANMVQYGALFLMICQALGYTPGRYVHSFSDAHIYEDQIDAVRALIAREPRRLPVMKLDPAVTDLFSFRKEHFTLEEYDPHPAMQIAYSP